MPKINREEYEVLKGLDDKWKWIARDKDRGLYAFTEKPVRKYDPSPYWDIEPVEPYSTLELFDEIHLFQFVQWEDEESHNIAELIEEYGSEETEVKKDLKEAILGIEVTQFDGQKADLEELVNPKQLEKIISDWMPEVLSQEWISENVEYAYFDMLDGSGRLSSATAIIKPKKLQNLLVPKQELPVIPKFVGEWIESRKNNYPFDVIGAYLRMNEPFANEQTREVLSWVHESKLNRGSFARAWLDGYEVEEEQKYQVIIRDGEYMRLYLCKHDGSVTIGTNGNYIEKCPEVTYLTEQEIKNYDERYWPFAVKVEELEE